MSRFKLNHLMISGAVAAILLVSAAAYGIFKLSVNNDDQQRLILVSHQVDSLVQAVTSDEVWRERFTLLAADAGKQQYVAAYQAVGMVTYPFITLLDRLIDELDAEADLTNRSLVQHLMFEQGNADRMERGIWDVEEAMLGAAQVIGIERAQMRDSVSLNAFYSQDVARREGKKNWSEFYFQGVSIAIAKTKVLTLKMDALQSKEWVLQKIYDKATE